MIWLIVTGALIVLLLLHFAIAVNGRKDGLVDMLGTLFCTAVIIVAIGLPIAGGYWLYTEGYQEDAGVALSQMEDAIGFSGGLVIIGSVMGAIGFLLMLNDAADWLEEMRPAWFEERTSGLDSSVH